jgi:hypothetical protein
MSVQLTQAVAELRECGIVRGGRSNAILPTHLLKSCLLYTVFGGKFSFGPLFCGKDCILLDLALCFGKLPDPRWRLRENRGKFLDEDG